MSSDLNRAKYADSMSFFEAMLKWCFVTPNVRGNAGPAEGRQARRKDDRPLLEAGLVDCRWASR